MNNFFVYIILFVSGFATAQGSWPTTVELDQSLDQYQDLKIRVKVFPHKRDYPPHLKDTKRKYIELHSEEACRIYRGAELQAAKADSPYYLERTIKIHLVNLNGPLWIDCNKPATLVRPGTEGMDYTYSGQFYVYKHYNRSHREHEIHVVNIIDMETYLRGVVPSEVYTSWPMESLKSQAVAARTYALFHLSVARQNDFGARPYNYFYDVDDTILFQAYTGLTHIHDRTDKAIADTHSLVLTHKQKIIQAYYHADSGGLKTESARSVWGIDVPYAKAKREPFGSSNSMSWKTTISKGELTRRLAKFDVLKKGESIKWIAPLKEHVTTTGRIKKLLIKTVQGQTKTITTKKLKRFINLNSNKFVVKATREGLIFEGHGSGHGVGMNQKGSQILAKSKGWKFEQILSYYYTQTKICSLTNLKKTYHSCYAMTNTSEAKPGT